MEKSSHEFGLERDELQKQLKQAIEANETFEQSRLDLQRQIIKLQLSKKELEMALSKSHSNLSQLRISIKLKESQFWQARNGGI